MDETQEKSHHLEQILLSESSQTKQWLSVILWNQEKRKALLELRGDRAQSCIDSLNNFVSDPEMRKSIEPGLLKYILIILRRLCEASMLYPTCYVLKDIHDMSLRSGGGFGDIYQGRYQRQLLCLKVARLYQDSDIKQLLKAHAREAIVWNQLDHPNVVPFYGIFYWEKRICLVSPWMENGDIVEFLRKEPNVPRKPLIDDIAKGLQYLHEQNIVHGDLKGRNILIDDRQHACLADFGLSSIITNGTLGVTRTASGPSGNTTRWTSPELFEEEGQPTCESDVWAFGCLCYEILTGMEPFAKCSDYQVMFKLMRGELPAQLDMVRLHGDEDLNNKFRELIGTCWSIEVGKRPRCPRIVDQLEADRLTRPSDHMSVEMPHRVRLNPSDLTTNLRRLKNLLVQHYHRTEVNNVPDIYPFKRMLDPGDTIRPSQLFLGPEIRASTQRSTKASVPRLWIDTDVPRCPGPNAPV